MCDGANAVGPGRAAGVIGNLQGQQARGNIKISFYVAPAASIGQR